MRAAVAGLVHESSTFATAVTGGTTLADFAVHTGTELMVEFTGTATCVGGYLAACADAGVEVVPAFHARAEPAGAVDRTAYERLRERLLATLPPGIPVVLLDLHGAGVIDNGGSLEVPLLHATRNAVGPEVVLAVTLDLHANVPPDLLSHADIVVGLHEYPHVDMAQRARRAAEAAFAAARGRVRPHTRQFRLPMVLPPSPTDAGPARELRDLARAAEQRPGVLACTVFHGFPYADTPQAGTSVITVTDGDDQLAAAVNEDVAGWVWRHRDRFRPVETSPDHAVAHARRGATRPVVVGDAADNPGGGGSGDGTYLLGAILAAGVRACFATLHDPAAVGRAARAGLGATVDLALGGRHGAASGPPLAVRGRVEAITDGHLIQQSVRRGKAVDFGQCVRLRVGAADLVVASNRVQVFDPQVFALHGIDPADYPLVAVKSAYHFRAGFRHLAGTLLTVDGPGLTSRRVDLMTPRRATAHLWPMAPSAPDRSAVAPMPARPAAVRSPAEHPTSRMERGR